MRRSSSRGSILLVVLIMIIFTSTALVAFIERAGDELIVPARVAAANRMRSTAYSAMETTIGVLSEFNRVNGSLHSPAEGWGDPLEWAQFPENENGFEIKVTFEDESGKMSLPNATAQNLTDLFTFWGLDAGLGSQLSDALMVWIKANYTPTSTGVSPGSEFLNQPVPFNPPARSLRSWDELKSIEVVQDTFFDDHGGLNYFGKRFEQAYSLYKFTSPNVNAGNPDTLAVTASLSSGAQEALLTYLNTKMTSASGGATTGNYFPTIAAATSAAQAASLPGMGVAISALRIHVTVRQKLAVFTLSTLVTGFTTPTATAAGGTGRAAGGGTTAATAAATAVAVPTVSASTTVTTPVSSTTSVPIIALSYPCTILELSESDIDPSEVVAAEATAQDAGTSSINGISFTPIANPLPSGSFLK